MACGAVMKAMFQPKPPLDFKPPIVKRKMPPYSGIAGLVGMFETDKPEPRAPFETPKERHARIAKATQVANDAKMEQQAEDWDPHKVRTGLGTRGDACSHTSLTQHVRVWLPYNSLRTQRR